MHRCEVIETAACIYPSPVCSMTSISTPNLLGRQARQDERLRNTHGVALYPSADPNWNPCRAPAAPTYLAQLGWSAACLGKQVPASQQWQVNWNCPEGDEAEAVQGMGQASGVRVEAPLLGQ